MDSWMATFLLSHGQTALSDDLALAVVDNF